MSAPAPGSIVSVTPITSMTAWQVTATQNFWTVMAALSEVGYVTTTQSSPNPANPSSPNWTINLSLPGYPTLVAQASDWIVFNGTVATVYTAAQFTAQFTEAS
jgi:hypothetical protein